MLAAARDSGVEPLRPRVVIAAGILSAVLAGCSSGSVIDQIPTELGGLPSNAPQRPASQPPYPGINEAGSRPNPALTPVEQLRLENDLSAVRAQQQRHLQDPGAAARAKTLVDKSTAARTQAIEAARKKATATDKR